MIEKWRKIKNTIISEDINKNKFIESELAEKIAFDNFQQLQKDMEEMNDEEGINQGKVQQVKKIAKKINVETL